MYFEIGLNKIVCSFLNIYNVSIESLGQILALVVHLLSKGLCSQGFKEFAFNRKIEKTGSLKWHNIELKHTRTSALACSHWIAG